MVLSTVCSVIFIPNFQFSIRYVSSYRKALELIWNFKMTWNESLIKIPKQYAYNSMQKCTQSLLRGKKKIILSSWFLQQRICLLTNNISKIINKSKAWLSYNTSCIYWHFPPTLRKPSVAQHIYSVPGSFYRHYSFIFDGFLAAPRGPQSPVAVGRKQMISWAMVQLKFRGARRKDARGSMTYTTPGVSKCDRYLKVYFHITLMPFGQH